MESKENKHLETQNEADNSAKAELDNVKKTEETAEEKQVEETPKDAVEETEEKAEATENQEESVQAEEAEEAPVEEVETVQAKEETVAEPAKDETAVEAPSAEEKEEAADPVAEKETPEAKEEVKETPVKEVETVQAEEEVVADQSKEESSEDLPSVEQKEEEKVEAEAPATKEEEAKEETEEEKPVKAEEAESEDENKEEDKPADEVSEDKKEAEKAEEKQEPEVDYSSFTEVELINEFRDLLENKPFMEIYQKVDLIKINFYKKNKQRVAQLRKEYLAGGGAEEEFKPEANPYEKDLKNLLNDYRQLKAAHNKELEAEKEKNVQLKYEIIEEIKNLVNRKESFNKTFQEFKELQQRWHDIGLVPQAAMKDLWENYHHHVENFYDYIKINKELRDLDLKKNMEEKIKLCEKAEELLLEPSVIKAFNNLQKLHDAWREIGPVPRDKKEELWERFKETTTKINKKHQEYFENRKKAQKKNLEAKTALCEKVEEVLDVELSSHKEWEDKSKEIVELQKYWRTIGFTPKKENNAIYERFRTACDSFFDKKREFYARHKEAQANNLQLKIDLCVQAEAIKDSTDWKKTTDEFIAIQKKWKEIGPVPRKHSDSVWKRFRAACDFFFESKSNFFNTKDESQLENLKLKKELIEEVKAFKADPKEEDNLEKLRGFQRRWTEIGHVPIGDKNTVQKEFRDAINVLFDELSVEDKERNLIRFKTKVTDWKSTSRGHNKMFNERDKYVAKLKQLESDLVTLQNNIGFFASSKNAEALIKDVKQKIKNNEEQIEYLKEKIRVIDDIEFSDE